MNKPNRRKFITTSAAATTALLITKLEIFAAENPPAMNDKKNFELIIMGTSWGFEGSVDEFCAKAKKEGYNGIEMWWPMEKKTTGRIICRTKKT